MPKRLAAVGGLVLAAFALLAVVERSTGAPTLRAAFDSAVQVVPGQQVRIAGRKVGTVGSVEAIDGDAIVELEISEGDAWPLHQGTTARLRWGSTSGYASRYVELHPGSASKPALPDGGTLPRAQTMAPVELDEVFRVFRGRGKGDLRTFVDELGATFHRRAPAVRRALRRSPFGFDQAAEVLDELGQDRIALRTLAVAGHRTSRALAERDGQLRDTLAHAAATLEQVAGRAEAVRRTLARLPGTFRVSGGTLGRLDRSLIGLRGLVNEIEPGARALRELAPAARGALAQLRTVAPLASATLRRGVEATPPITDLLALGTPLLRRLRPALDRATPMVACLRPYGPEIAGVLSTWIGFAKNYDALGHYARFFMQAPPVPVGSPLAPAEAVEAKRGALGYAMPRPPGLNAGQPWFQPRCGAGPQALDPAADPEASR